ncbi:hypothetical protein ACQKOD_18165 [Bacillus mycoides]|uniref:hypothetical protein n=1 Tax=Bacillus mycoides TaxID=1405 RepID=UPI003CFF410A
MATAYGALYAPTLTQHATTNGVVTFQSLSVQNSGVTTPNSQTIAVTGTGVYKVRFSLELTLQNLSWNLFNTSAEIFIAVNGVKEAESKVSLINGLLASTMITSTIEMNAGKSIILGLNAGDALTLVFGTINDPNNNLNYQHPVLEVIQIA